MQQCGNFIYILSLNFALYRVLGILQNLTPTECYLSTIIDETHAIIDLQFQVLLSALVGWALCYILTVTEAISSDSEARTDKVISNSLSLAPWLVFDEMKEARAW